MGIKKDECWSDNRPYYVLYQDKKFLKDIYAQLFSSFPDVGEIAYIGASTHRLAKDYGLDGEQGQCIDRRKNGKENEWERNRKNENRNKARLNIVDSSEESQIREYANIQEIKEMNNMLFYKQLIKKLVGACIDGGCNNLCFIKDRMGIYDNYKEGEDVFIKMRDSCVWLKKSYMDTTAINVVNVFGNVNMIGYILEQESETTPRVIKALAIYT